MINWKEAASILLVRPLSSSIKKKALRLPPNLNPSTISSLNSFQNIHDYEIFVGIRSAKLKFFASSLAFPGGAIENQDKDAHMWREVLKQPQECVSVPSPCLFVRLPMYENKRLSDAELDPRIAFRLCAIRELAEETGMLLSVKSTTKLPNSDPRSMSKFMNTLLEMGRLPAVNMLYDWRSWLTPRGFSGSKGPKQNHRFDTVFYIAFVDNEDTQIGLLPDHKDEEMGETRWATVPELVTDYLSGKLNLPPPQLHEFATLLRYPKYSDLEKFVRCEMIHDKLQRWLPIRAQFTGPNDPIVTLLPGDSAYPTNEKEAVAVDLLEFDETFEQNIKKCKNLHRNYWINGEHGKPEVKIICSFDRFGTDQLTPLEGFENRVKLSHL